MGKQAKNEILGKVYREFSRQKYNKYKAQFPKLRESEIVTKIIKEWDALNIAAKENLQKLYIDKQYLTIEDISSSEAIVRSNNASKEHKKQAEYSAKKKSPQNLTATRLYYPSKKEDKDGSDFNRGSEQRDDSRLGQSSSHVVIVNPEKHKPIAKSQSDYISFFKTYYKKLSKEHPRWRTNQISSVIKLLWKKQKSHGKTLKKRDGRLRTSKPISGRRFFRRTRQLDRFEAKIKWFLLPRETKNYWDHESKGVQINLVGVEGTLNLKSSKTSIENNFSFLARNIY